MPVMVDTSRINGIAPFANFITCSCLLPMGARSGTTLSREPLPGRRPGCSKECPSIGCEVPQRRLMPLQLIDCSTSTGDPHTVDTLEFYTSHYHGDHYRMVGNSGHVPCRYMAIPEKTLPPKLPSKEVPVRFHLSVYSAHLSYPAGRENPAFHMR